MQVTLGEHDISATGEGSLTEKTVAIAAISRHESYNAAAKSHDIAVLELAEEVDLDTYNPACMAQVGRCVTVMYYVANTPPAVLGHGHLLWQGGAGVRLGHHLCGRELLICSAGGELRYQEYRMNISRTSSKEVYYPHFCRCLCPW